MKKLLTLGNILKCCAALLGLVAFFMIFAKQVWMGNSNIKLFMDNKDLYFDGDIGAPIGFVGYLLILLGALGMCAMIFLKDLKMGKIIVLCLAGLLLLGAIFVFIEASVVDSNAKLAGGPVVAGIFAILAALLGCASEFVKK